MRNTVYRNTLFFVKSTIYAICACHIGFEDVNDDGTDCLDIDECLLETDNCHDNANCTNTEGSFECECLDGYEGNGVNCTDID